MQSATRLAILSHTVEPPFKTAWHLSKYQFIYATGIYFLKLWLYLLTCGSYRAVGWGMKEVARRQFTCSSKEVWWIHMDTIMALPADWSTSTWHTLASLNQVWLVGYLGGSHRQAGWWRLWHHLASFALCVCLTCRSLWRQCRAFLLISHFSFVWFSSLHRWVYTSICCKWLPLFTV